MNIDEETKRKIIDLRNQHKKKIRKIVSEVDKSSRDVTTVLKENEIKQAQTTKDEKEYEVDKDVQNSHSDSLPNVRAYMLFDEGKSPLEVAAELNLPGPQVQQFYVEYWKLKHMHHLFNVYQEIQNSIGYFLKLFRLGKQEDLTPEQLIRLIKMADNVHNLEEKFHQLQSEVIDMGMRKSVGKDQLKDLHNEIQTAQEKLNSADKAFKVKYEELTETCSQIQKVENYLERLKEGQDYQELEATVRSEVGKTLLSSSVLSLSQGR